MTVHDCRLIELPTFSDPRGSLTCFESTSELPFTVERIFYVYDVPAGKTRGAHAHKIVEQLCICVAGACTILLDDTMERRTVRLERPSAGLYIPAMIWAELGDFAPGSVCVVLASERFSQGDYLRDYADYVRSARAIGIK